MHAFMMRSGLKFPIPAIPIPAFAVPYAAPPHPSIMAAAMPPWVPRQLAVFCGLGCS